jgi:2-amino-4-hydroxy-6-hydroxymethyldihydropteridine diphosphokinase
MSLSKPAKRVQTAYLGLGSNLGERRAHLTDALVGLAAAYEVRISRVSPVYETLALCLPGQAAQPDYLNLVVELETTLTPHALLRRWPTRGSSTGAQSRASTSRWTTRAR